jgi:hypothetical protein
MILVILGARLQTPSGATINYVNQQQMDYAIVDHSDEEVGQECDM